MIVRRQEFRMSPFLPTRVETMKYYPINIFYSDADKGYIADIPDLDACSAFGKTPPMP